MRGPQPVGAAGGVGGAQIGQEGVEQHPLGLGPLGRIAVVEPVDADQEVGRRAAPRSGGGRLGQAAAQPQPEPHAHPALDERDHDGTPAGQPQAGELGDAVDDPLQLLVRVLPRTPRPQRLGHVTHGLLPAARVHGGADGGEQRAQRGKAQPGDAVVMGTQLEGRLDQYVDGRPAVLTDRLRVDARQRHALRPLAKMPGERGLPAASRPQQHEDRKRAQRPLLSVQGLGHTPAHGDVPLRPAGSFVDHSAPPAD